MDGAALAPPAVRSNPQEVARLIGPLGGIENTPARTFVANLQAWKRVCVRRLNKRRGQTYGAGLGSRPHSPVVFLASGQRRGECFGCTAERVVFFLGRNFLFKGPVRQRRRHLVVKSVFANE